MLMKILLIIYDMNDMNRDNSKNINTKDASIDNNDKLYFNLTSIYISNINAIAIRTIAT